MFLFFQVPGGLPEKCPPKLPPGGPRGAFGALPGTPQEAEIDLFAPRGPQEASDVFFRPPEVSKVRSVRSSQVKRKMIRKGVSRGKLGAAKGFRSQRRKSPSLALRLEPRGGEPPSQGGVREKRFLSLLHSRTSGAHPWQQSNKLDSLC